MLNLNKNEMTSNYNIGDYVWFSSQKTKNGVYTSSLGKIVDIEYRMSKEGTCIKIQSINTEDTVWVFIGQVATDGDTIKSITTKLNKELKQKIKEDILSYKTLIDTLQEQLSEIEDIV